MRGRFVDSIRVGNDICQCNLSSVLWSKGVGLRDVRPHTYVVRNKREFEILPLFREH